jgi:hypothetical protein
MNNYQFYAERQEYINATPELQDLAYDYFKKLYELYIAYRHTTNQNEKQNIYSQMVSARNFIDYETFQKNSPLFYAVRISAYIESASRQYRHEIGLI